MNLIEDIKEILDDFTPKDVHFPQAQYALRVIQNYLNATALARGWTLDEFCSWLEDNYGEE